MLSFPCCATMAQQAADIVANEQLSTEFLSLNPNSKMTAILDLQGTRRSLSQAEISNSWPITSLIMG
jgi:hypothetical protein